MRLVGFYPASHSTQEWKTPRQKKLDEDVERQQWRCIVSVMDIGERSKTEALSTSPPTFFQSTGTDHSSAKYSAQKALRRSSFFSDFSVLSSFFSSLETTGFFRMTEMIRPHFYSQHLFFPTENLLFVISYCQKTKTKPNLKYISMTKIWLIGAGGPSCCPCGIMNRDNYSSRTQQRCCNVFVSLLRNKLPFWSQWRTEESGFDKAGPQGPCAEVQ